MRSAQRTTALVTVMVAVATLALTGVLGSATAADSFKMAVIDPIEVMEKSKAGRRALDGLREYVTTRQKVLASDEEEFKNLEKQFRDQAPSLNDSQKRDREEQLRVKAQSLQRRFQDFNQELSAKQKEVMDEYMKKIQTATKVVAERGGFSLVVDKGSESTGKIVIFNKDALDITDQVIKEFDRQNK